MALFDAARAELADAQQAVRAELERHDAELEKLLRRLSQVRLSTVAAGVAIILVSRRLLARWITEPVEGLGRAVRVVAGGELDRLIPALGPPDVAELGRDVEAMRKRLLAEVERARAAQAALAQRGMVVLGLRDELAPGRLDLHDGVHIAAGFRPAEGVVAGDWYDVVPLGPDRLAIALVDVSGHGAGAGVFALKTKHLTLAALRNGLGPAEALAWLAAQLGDTGDHFLTGVVLELDLAAGRVHYANAGHPPVLVQARTVLSELGPTGPLLGPLPGVWAEASIPVPRRVSRSWVLTTVSFWSTSQAFSWSWSALSVAQASPWPSGRWGRTRSHTWAISSSPSCPSPPSRTSPHATAASR